jgi:hypothetical protein
MSQIQKNEDLKPILTKLKEAKRVVNVAREDVPFALKEGWGIKRREALDTIGTLTKQLKQLVIPGHLVGIYVTGTEDVLGALSTLVINYDGLQINADKLYLDVAEELKPTFGSDHMVKLDTFMKLTQLYYESGRAFEIQELSPLHYSEVECPKNKDLVDYVKTQIRGAVGDELAIRVLTRALLDGILNRELSGRYIPVMITQASDADKNALSKLFIKTIDLDLKTIEDATKENLMKTVKRALTQ